MRTAVEPEGIHCATGGARFEVGVDANGDGTLDDNEADATLTRYVCNGAQGPQGLQGEQGLQGPAGSTGAEGKRSLVSTSAEAAGPHCATGGIKLEAGVDADGDGTLEPEELDWALTRYVCNGAQGPQGLQGFKGDKGDIGDTGPQGLKGDKGDTGDTGPQGLQGPKGDKGDIGDTGPQGPQGFQGLQGPKGDKGDTGPQGPTGTLGLYGDGSAGAFNVTTGQTVDLSTSAGVLSLPAGFNMQFSSISIAGNLIVPSGTLLRSTGDVTVSGTITVLPGVEDVGNSEAPPGVSRTPAATYHGGQGLTALQAASVLRPGVEAGGAGARLYAGEGANGGAGGGALTIASKGSVRIMSGALVNANGQNGVNPMTATASIVGTGGGAGGVVVIAAKGAITMAGTVRANGGNGADGFNGNGGTGEGGGGGGGGGIIHLIASSSPSVTGTLQVAPGAGGANAPATSGTSVLTAGGGGACGGNGGTAGGFIPGTQTIVGATGGQSGHVLTTVAPEPETLMMR